MCSHAALLRSRSVLSWVALRSRVWILLVLLVSMRGVALAPSRGPPPRSCPLTWAAFPTGPRRSPALMGGALPTVGRIGAIAPRPLLRRGRKIVRRVRGSSAHIARRGAVALARRYGRQPSPAPDFNKPSVSASGLRPACFSAQCAPYHVKDT